MCVRGGGEVSCRDVGLVQELHERGCVVVTSHGKEGAVMTVKL